MMDLSEIEQIDYPLLKDFRLEFENATFSLSFWIYLLKTTQFPVTILNKVHLNAEAVPFLVLDTSKKLLLLQLPSINKEIPDSADSTPSKEVPYVGRDIEFPLDKWVHVGCEISSNFARLYINGEIVGVNALSSSLSNHSNPNVVKVVTLIGANGINDVLQGYFHDAKVSPLESTMKELYIKDPPLELSINVSSASDIDEGNDGVWNIVGGKASCRKNFSLDVVLNALGQPVHKEMEIIASLVYDDNGTLVEKPDDEEAPLLTTYDGIEFASCDRPSKLLQGRASFKLKISQLSSKCDNRLFRIRFDIPKIGYPFLKAFSHPIRCISRNRHFGTSTLILKKPSPAIHRLNGFQMFGLENGFSDFQNGISEAKPTLASNGINSGQEKTSHAFKVNVPTDESDVEYFSHARTVNKVQSATGLSFEGKQANHEQKDNSPSDSESIEAMDSLPKNVSNCRNKISDLTVFKYCLGGIHERALMLKELASSSLYKELADFAQQVSLYSGCFHHRNQIIMAKKMIEQGQKAWDIISQNNDLVSWENIFFYIEDQFKNIARCNTRSLSQQDFEILRRVAGCREYMTRENFEKLWCWLYPVALTLSTDRINSMWASTSPKWIEGFVTKEEAEFSLQGPRGLQEPGTFILRFPTSRSWPHPDAGSLVVTYVGGDYSLHHRLLSIDYICSTGMRGANVKPLQDMLLEEPELSRLGRIMRSY